MKKYVVDRVIMVLTDNKLYENFWEFSSKFWINKFGIKPTLFVYGKINNISLKRNIGEVHDLPFVPEVSVNPSRDWACTWGLFYGASLFPNDVCMTIGIDQAPLSNKFLNHIAHYDYDKDYVVGHSDAYHNPNWFVSSHHFAKGSVYKKALCIEDSWEAEVKKVFAYRNDFGKMYDGDDFWGLDELYSTMQLKKYEHTKAHTGLFHEITYPNRIDRNGLNFPPDIERLRAGGYSELHAFRPFHHLADTMNLIYDNTPSYI